ncbi:MAG: hypothetical protein V4692_13070 [Bdellovibrionota bacterium]
MKIAYATLLSLFVAAPAFATTGLECKTLDKKTSVEAMVSSAGISVTKVIINGRELKKTDYSADVYSSDRVLNMLIMDGDRNLNHMSIETLRDGSHAAGIMFDKDLNRGNDSKLIICQFLS